MIVDLKDKKRWRVWTDNDVEGRTIKELGIVEGELIEVIKAFGEQQYYNLNLEVSSQEPTVNLKINTKPFKNIHFHVWGLDNKKHALDTFRLLFPEENFELSQYWNSIQLIYTPKTEASKKLSEMINDLF